MPNDRKVLNYVLMITLLVSPIVGVLFLDAPPDVAESQVFFAKASMGLGYGIGFGMTFATMWLVLKILKR